MTAVRLARVQIAIQGSRMKRCKLLSWRAAAPGPPSPVISHHPVIAGVMLVAGMSACIVACASTTAAQDTGARSAPVIAQTPLPPRRPAHLDSREPRTPAVVPPRASPRTTPARPAQTPAIDDTAYHPMTDTSATGPSRAAVRACTEEWRKLRQTGATGALTWREFSMNCLTRKQ